MNVWRNTNGPIFIVGAPRSGTTLLQYMLRSHPRISLPTGETHFIVPLYRERAGFGDLTQPENVRRVLEEMHRRNAGFLDTDLHGIRFHVDDLVDRFVAEKRTTIPDLVRGLLETNAVGEGKVRWGDKTPYYVLHLPTVLEMFPDAQIIHIIRDGRDCALSMFNRRHDFSVYNTYSAATYWAHYVETGQRHGRALNRDKYLEIRYEDLVREPVSVVRRICTFLHEEYDEAVVNFKKSGEAGKTPLLQQPIQKDNAEKWRRAMSARQIRTFEAAAGEVLRANGYPILTSTNPLSGPFQVLYRVHNELAARLHRTSTNR